MSTIEERYSDLFKRELRLEEVFSEWPGMMLLADEEGEILFSTDAMKIKFGCADHQACQKIWHFFDDENLNEAYFHNALKQCIEGRKVDFSTALSIQGDTLLWLEIRMKVFKLVKNPKLIICSASDITRQKEAEKELIQSKASVDAILEVVENERIQIGRELHDGVGQILSAVSLMAHNLKRKLNDEGLECFGDLEEIISMIREADDATRNLAHGMVHIELEKEGLKFALRRICERYQTLKNTECVFTCCENLVVEDQLMALHLFRIAQEATRNAFKHGKASRIEIKLENIDHFLRLSISDNGKGISAEDLNNVKIGMGISTMRYRAGILGGSLKISNTPEGITCLECLVPK